MKRSDDRHGGRLRTTALLVALTAGPAAAQVPAGAPAAFDVADRAPLMTLHGVGAQIYACAADPSGRMGWSFREPVATLVADGKTVGRHYLGPTWALADGSLSVGKAASSAPGATPADVPLLKLSVVGRQGPGPMAGATLVLRLNTRGGVLSGACDHAGDLRAEPYTADYVFLR